MTNQKRAKTQRCVAMTKRGTRCKSRSAIDSEYCHQHVDYPMYKEPEPLPRCAHMISAGSDKRQCTKPVYRKRGYKGDYCYQHARCTATVYDSKGKPRICKNLERLGNRVCGCNHCETVYDSKGKPRICKSLHDNDSTSASAKSAPAKKSEIIPIPIHTVQVPPTPTVQPPLIPTVKVPPNPISIHTVQAPLIPTVGERSTSDNTPAKKSKIIPIPIPTVGETPTSDNTPVIPSVTHNGNCLYVSRRISPIGVPPLWKKENQCSKRSPTPVCIPAVTPKQTASCVKKTNQHREASPHRIQAYPLYSPSPDYCDAA